MRLLRKLTEVIERVEQSAGEMTGRIRRDVSWQHNKPLTHERSWFSWGPRRQRGGWWGASGSRDWASTRLQPPLEPPIPEERAAGEFLPLEDGNKAASTAVIWLAKVLLLI